jgi:glucose-1-phosphate adenylyltransferase
MLNHTIREDLFNKYGQIYTKAEDDIPARYGNNAAVSNSLISDGCIVEGSVENSILFRNVRIGKGSKLCNSIIMQNSVIGENVYLNCVLADINVLINDNRTLMGYDLYPVYIKKGSNI